MASGLSERPAYREIGQMFGERQMDNLRQFELSKYTEEYFATEYWKEDLESKSGNRGLSYNDPTHHERFKLIAETIFRFVDADSYLDAGCGPGLLCSALARGLKTVTGIDAAEAAVNLANIEKNKSGTHFSVIKGALSELEFASNEFDCVLCLDVLEHLPVFDIGSSLSELIRVCNDYLIFSINTDNPYKYHPTVLSGKTWRAMFSSQDLIYHDDKLERLLTEEICSKREEYDFFCYRKVGKKI